MIYPNDLVCPECGWNEFTVREVREVSKTISFPTGYECETGEEEIISSETDSDSFICTDCFESFQDTHDLCTRAVWEAAEDENL